jgi:hypothetical protein
MTMVLAFGTSTPTSMTVVATSTSMRPAANDCMMASFSSLDVRPCSDSMRRAARAGCARSSAVVSVTLAIFRGGMALPSVEAGVAAVSISASSSTSLASIAGHTTKTWRPCAISSAARVQVRS